MTAHEDGVKERPVIGQWKSADLHGRPLDISILSGKLLTLRGFQRTICTVREFPYLVNRINGRKPKEIVEAREALAALEAKVAVAVSHLRWEDFEVLVDLLFRAGGWQRTGPVGRSQKTLDIDLIAPISDERYAVQVKSTANGRVFSQYKERFTDMQGYTRCYFVVHSPTGGLARKDETSDCRLWLPEDLARLTVRYGLAEWLFDKSS